MDLLTTLACDLEVQVPLMSTIHKSSQHPLSILKPVVSSPAIPWQRLLTVKILQLRALMPLPPGRLATEIMLQTVLVI
jgi:hypothetical protein